MATQTMKFAHEARNARSPEKLAKQYSKPEWRESARVHLNDDKMPKYAMQEHVNATTILGNYYPPSYLDSCSGNFRSR